jgi:DNA-directed RNA polymerase specialized sigma24 family protein
MLTRNGSQLDDQALLALWEQGLRLARRYCAEAWRRLARGEGGFYDADDLQQDLFLVFSEVVQAWQEQPEHPLADLWRRWGRCLWGGGIHILRRPPQRLWWRAEQAVDPTQFTLDHLERRQEAGMAPPPFLAHHLEQLVDEQGAEERALRLGALDDLEERLWRLRPLQRQALYLVALRNWQPAELAERLGLDDVQAAYQLLYQARQKLHALPDGEPDSQE